MRGKSNVHFILVLNVHIMLVVVAAIIAVWFHHVPIPKKQIHFRVSGRKCIQHRQHVWLHRIVGRRPCNVFAVRMSKAKI